VKREPGTTKEKSRPKEKKPSKMPEYGTLFGNSNLIMKNKVEKNKNDLII